MALGQMVTLNLQLKDCVELGKDKMLMTWVQMQNEYCKLVGVDPLKSFYNFIAGEAHDDVEDKAKGQDQQLKEREMKAKQKQNEALKNSILTRLSGKYGRFRGNLSGKRVNYSGRSVISPDPNLQVDEVGVPYAVSRTLTFPVVVTEGNIDYIRELIKNDQVEKIEKNAAFFEDFALPPKQKHQSNDWWEYQFVGAMDTDQVLFIREDKKPYRRQIEVKNRTQTARQNYQFYFEHNVVQAAPMMTFTPDAEPAPFEQRTSDFTAEEQQKTYEFLTIPTTTLLQTQRQVDLEPGDVAHRFLRNGDHVLFNRQPSLHKSSISLFRARIHPFRTFKFNVANCANFGADFDGDEMNVHFPQGAEAAAEGSALITHESNLVDNANQAMSMNIMQDAISGLYLISRESWFQYDEYCKWVLVDTQSMGKPDDFLGDANIELNPAIAEKYATKNDLDAPEDFFSRFYGKRNNLTKVSPLIQQPAILFPAPVFTGKQIISQVFLNHTQNNPFNYSNGDVVVKSSVLYKGIVTKKHIGGIFQAALQAVTMNQTADKTLERQVLDLMYSIQRIVLKYMQTYGFSIGLEDIWQSDAFEEQKLRYVDECLSRMGYTQYDQIEQLWNYKEYRHKLSTLSPPTKIAVNMKSPTKTEGEISAALSDLRNRLSEDLIRFIYHYNNVNHNSTLVMSRSGSKGSIINQIQMTSLLSQQTVQNAMIKRFFGDRTLPHFSQSALHNPYQFGFIQNSFFTGLNPFEFFFHTTSGREGVIDTAVKTANTGYIQRKLLKNLESTVVDWNYNVVAERIVLFNPFDESVLNRLYNTSLEPFLQEQLSILMTNAEMTDQSEQFKYCSNVDEVMELAKRNYLGLPPTENELASIEKVLSENESYRKIPVENLKLLFKKVRELVNRQPNWLEPGTPVGALAGQAMGEPTTQMTLKTFHFAGLASKISGVPRLIQIFNAAKNDKATMYIYPMPVVAAKKAKINVYGVQNEHVDAKTQALFLRNQFEQLCLEQIAEISEIVSNSSISIDITLNQQLLKDLCVTLKPQSVIDAIIHQVKQKPKLTPSSFQVLQESNVIRIQGFMHSNLVLAGRVQQLLAELRGVVVAGLPECEVFVNDYKRSDLVKSENYKQMMRNRHSFDGQATEPDQDGQYLLMLTTPKNPRQLLNHQLVDPRLSYTTSVHATYEMFGVEAARQQILDEVYTLYKDYGMNLCYYHVQILASYMTMTGQVLGSTNQGLKVIKRDKTILLASFERTGEYLFAAGINGVHEQLTDVSEDLIFGNCFKVGSGFASIQWDGEGAQTGRPW